MAGISGANLKERLPRINALEEKCSLLFFFLRNEDLCEFPTANDVIQCIEGDYRQAFQERVTGITSSCTQSLVYVVDEPITRYLWEESLATVLARDLKCRAEDISDRYPRLIGYYQRLAEEADGWLKQLTEASFETVYQQLLGIDAKCRMVLSDSKYFLTNGTTDTEFLTMVEDSYLTAHHELFLDEPLWYEEQALGYQLGSIHRMTSVS